MSPEPSTEALPRRRGRPPGRRDGVAPSAGEVAAPVTPAPPEPAVAASGPLAPIQRAVARYLADVERRVAAGQVVPEVAVSLRRNAERMAVIVAAAPADVAIDGWPALVSASAPGLKGLSPGSLEIVRGVARQLGALARADG